MRGLRAGGSRRRWPVRGGHGPMVDGRPGQRGRPEPGEGASRRCRGPGARRSAACTRARRPSPRVLAGGKKSRLLRAAGPSSSGSRGAAWSERGAERGPADETSRRFYQSFVKGDAEGGGRGWPRIDLERDSVVRGCPSITMAGRGTYISRPHFGHWARVGDSRTIGVLERAQQGEARARRRGRPPRRRAAPR